MIHLTHEQERIYQLLFDSRSKITKNHSNQNIKQLSERFKTIFGYPIFDCFLVNESAGKNLCYYLENIVLYTKFMTYLVFDHESIFTEFYQKVAELCVEVIQAFCEENSWGENAIYTSEFKKHLHNTILFSLKPNEKDAERIREIFRLKIAIITASAMIHYSNRSYAMSKKTLELCSEMHEQRSRKKEQEFTGEFIRNIKLIIEKNGIELDFFQNDLIRLNVNSLQEKESIRIENILLAPGRAASNLFGLALLFAILTVWMAKEKEPLAPLLFMMTGLSIIVSCLMGPGEKGKASAQQSLRNVLLCKQKSLADHLSLEAIDYSKKEEEAEMISPCKIFSFKPLALSYAAEPGGIPDTSGEKKKEKRPRSFIKEKLELNLGSVQNKSSDMQQLPPKYYNGDSFGQLIFFDKDAIKHKGKCRDSSMDPAAFVAELDKRPDCTIRVRKLEQSEKKKYPEADYKVYPPTVSTARYFGHEKQHTVNGAKRAVCVVDSWKYKTH